ncbi:hypothetical protein B0H14DRAFT_2341092 [Mycena olivaceomarginata]|nr:hypothetical protein B0H14DRAFT_2341092 [Mycena olivaceomarginata]
MSPPAKRQQTEDAPITRSDIWFTDGSVVLQAQSTQFRVHWGVLTQNSSFFRDMQALPQANVEQPTVEGCPLVELHDDVEDVKHLLTILYNPTLPVPSKKTHEFAVVAALIRLGRKYDFRNLLDAAIEVVMLANPTTLDKVASASKNRCIDYYRGIEFDMLALARENNIMMALPYAYYRVVRQYTQLELLDGVAIKDCRKTSLDPIDQRQCLLGRERMMMKQMLPGYTLGWFANCDHGDCTNIQECSDQRELTLQVFFEIPRVRALDSHVSYCRDELCAACARHLEELFDAGRKRMWQDLPSFFDLPPWNELKNDP